MTTPADPGTGRADEAVETSGAIEAGRAVETGGAECDRAAEAEGAGAAAGPRPDRRMLRLVSLAAAVVVLGGFGIWATVHARDLRAAVGQDNVAVTDSAATEAARGQVTAEVSEIFSYSYNSTGRTRAAAQRVLTGQAIRQYDQLFTLVERSAPQEKLVLVTKVVAAGVEFLSGNRARVLVFANQQDTVAGTQRSSYAGSMLAVNAVHLQGRWKISSIDTFTAGS